MSFNFNNLGLKPLNLAVFAHHPTDTLQRLDNAFWQALNKPPSEDNPFAIKYRELYFIFICSLHQHSGIAGDHALDAIEKLTKDSLRDLDLGWVYLPRYSDAIPKYLHPTSLAIGMSLMIQLGRGRGPGRNRVGPPSPKHMNAPLYELVEQNQPKLTWGKAVLPNIQTIRLCASPPRAPWLDGNPPLTVKQIRKQIRRQYHTWLKDFGRIAELEHTLFGSHFRNMIRTDFHQRLPADYKSWIELQMDEWPHNPAPIEQWEEFHALAEPLDFDEIAEVQHDQELLNRIRRPEWLQRALRLEQVLEAEIEIQLEEKADLSFLDDIRDVVNEYKRLKKKPTAEERAKFRKRLKTIAEKAKSDLNKLLDGDEVDQHGREARNLYHTHLIASWLTLSFKGKGSPPATPSHRLTTLRVLLTKYPDLLLTKVEEDHLSELAEDREYATSSFQNFLGNFMSFRHHVEHTLKKEITDGSNFKKLYRFAPEIYPAPLLTKEQLEDILGCLLIFGENGQLAYYAVLLQTAFGIRVGSVLEVNIDGLANLDKPYPTLTVPPIKDRKGFDAQIAAEHIDPGTLAALEAFRRKRLAETGGDGSQPLIGLPNGRVFTYDMYAYVLKNAMRYSDNRIKKGRIHSVTHVLRHYAANRWLALGLPLRLIRDYLNHRHDSTTVGSYLHAVHFKLAELLFVDVPKPAIRLSQRGAAFLLGVTTRQMRDLAKELLLFAPHRRSYEFGEVMSLLQHFYEQTKPVPEVEEDYETIEWIEDWFRDGYRSSRFYF